MEASPQVPHRCGDGGRHDRVGGARLDVRLARRDRDWRSRRTWVVVAAERRQRMDRRTARPLLCAPWSRPQREAPRPGRLTIVASSDNTHERYVMSNVARILVLLSLASSTRAGQT